MKHIQRTLILAFAVTAMVTSPLAQFDTGGSSKPWSSFKLPKKNVKLDFKNANVDMVLQYFSKAAGITIVKDPSLSQPITLSTASAIPLEEAFDVLSAALSVRKFELQKDGKILVVRAKPQQGGRGGNNFGGGNAGFDPSMLEGMGQQSQLTLKVYQLKNALASTVARTLNDVYQSSGGGLQFPNFGGGGRIQFGGGGNNRNGGRGFNFGGMNSGPNVRASSDDYSNSVIVNASRNDQKQVEDLIKQLDRETDEAVRAVVYPLEFAFSDDLQAVIQGVLTANVPRGRGGQSTSTQVDQRFTFFPFGGNNQNRNNGQVVSEPRTNSLIVTTTPENQELIAKVIKDLDKEIKYEPSTFVIPLDNARADQMATLLQQAFGRRQGVNGGNTNQGRNTQGTNTNRNRNNNNGGGGGIQFNGGGSNRPDGSTMPIELQDPEAEFGELQTNIDVEDMSAQFFIGGQNQNQNQNRNNQSRQTTGRDAQGRLVNIQDPTNQITIIPDTNTNTVIVVGSPEQAELVKKIIGQLDKIPEQVMIETIIVEATLSSSDKLGVDWRFVQNKAFGNAGTTGTVEQNLGTAAANGQGFRYTLAGGDLSAFINALKSDTKFQVLSTPRIFTSNNVNAEINISQRVPFVTSQRTDANGNITFNYSFEDVGIVLNVTPRITAGGYVTMEVLQTANDLQGFTDFNAPIVNQRQADTTVAVKDGETIILGGIIRSTVNSTVKKIPLLGDIPILGNLFRSTDKSKAKTELLVFLTPRVVRTPEDAAKLRKEQQKKFSEQTQKELEKTIGNGNGGKGDNKQEEDQTPVKRSTGGGQ